MGRKKKRGPKRKYRPKKKSKPIKKVVNRKNEYMIIMTTNGKKSKLLKKTEDKEEIDLLWYSLKRQQKPKFHVETSYKRHRKVVNEMLLIYPVFKNTKYAPVYKKDELGRNIEVKLEKLNEKFRIKALMPWLVEEKIFDDQLKKHITYDEFYEKIVSIEEFAQIFKLKSKIFIQIEEDFTLYKCKNLNDADRLFEIVKDDLLKNKKTNFLFVKDITTNQRRMLYDMLEKKGYKRTELFRNYSY